jgi:acetylornithine deacetylase/succinyl-diaminopimelate desuccinylase-like protein
MVLATYYELLKDYISFKTIHDTTTFATEAEKAVKRIANLLTKNHFEVKEYNVDDTPILIAKFVQNKNLPTALIYTNYDLQLQEISSDWKNNPFNLYLGKEEIIGRGVAESKGQFVIYLATILNLLQNDQL